MRTPPLPAEGTGSVTMSALGTPNRPSALRTAPSMLASGVMTKNRRVPNEAPDRRSMRTLLMLLPTLEKRSTRLGSFGTLVKKVPSTEGNRARHR
jgi:hypothetical protein